MTLKDLKREMENGAIVAVSTGLGQRVTREEMIAGDGHRNGAVRDRSQVHNPKTNDWTKRDTETGKFMDRKTSDNDPFKGVRKEK